MSPPLIDLLGQTFGCLTVIARAPKGRTRAILWRCLCVCGNERVAPSQMLRLGRTWSCGCRKRTSSNNKTHGMSNTRVYAIYRGIIARCENPNVKAFPHYGGRGIKMCGRWRKSFEKFVEDMGYPPSPKHGIDRINANGNYSKKNCRWATVAVQINNRRNTRYVEYRGHQQPLTDAVRLAGSVVHYETAWQRIKIGWPIDLAIETPRLFAGRARAFQPLKPQKETAA